MAKAKRAKKVTAVAVATNFDTGMRVGEIERSIVMIRGEKVVLDADLAALYGVTTKRLNEQVKRNSERFPEEFLVHLTWEETGLLRSQTATLNAGKRGAHPKYRPYAFTEHGAIMAATVLSSPRAVQMSVYVVRAFVRMRQMLAQHAEIIAKLSELEHKVDKHDGEIAEIIAVIQQLMAPPPQPKRKPIGFQSEIEA